MSRRSILFSCALLMFAMSARLGEAAGPVELSGSKASATGLVSGSKAGEDATLARQAPLTIPQDEIDALRKRLHALWNPPNGDPAELVVDVEFRLKRDGTLDGEPRVITRGNSKLFEDARARAVMAIMRGQPYTMLKPEYYEQWKDVVITFDPRDQ